MSSENTQAGLSNRLHCYGQTVTTVNYLPPKSSMSKKKWNGFGPFTGFTAKPSGTTISCKLSQHLLPAQMQGIEAATGKFHGSFWTPTLQ